MSTRRLAGSRRNKHLPIARRTRRCDLHQIVRDWSAGRMSHDAAAAELAHVFRDEVVKPDHAARAVDIHAIWPPLTLDDSTAKQRTAAEAGARGKSAAPMSTAKRIEGYKRQNGGAALTARQSRKATQMYWRAQPSVA